MNSLYWPAGCLRVGKTVLFQLSWEGVWVGAKSTFVLSDDHH